MTQSSILLHNASRMTNADSIGSGNATLGLSICKNLKCSYLEDDMYISTSSMNVWQDSLLTEFLKRFKTTLYLVKEAAERFLEK